MLTNLVSLITKSLSSTNTTAIAAPKQKESFNPFKSEENANPFLSVSFGSSASYGKNQPVSGGYFAGYYNGKPNIVGRRLFIEV